MNTDIRELEAELEWLARVIRARLDAYFSEPSASPPLPELDLPPPELHGGRSPYAQFVCRHGLDPAERLLALLALTPHLRPQLLDVLWTRSEATQRGFTEFGGLQGVSHGGFMPTIETGAFLLGGEDLATRLQTVAMVAPDQRLVKLNVLQYLRPTPGEPALSAALQASKAWLGLVMRDVATSPAFDQHFPARKVGTGREWSELVLPPATLEQLEDVQRWLRHGRTLMEEWDMGRKLHPGYTCLFCGPPGTGKTLSACLLGKQCGCEVYKIDLSMVVSKYVGETEKNLARVFDEAEHRGWILFFDEADALFGKRTQVESSHDRYANQEVSYLLQRIEDFDGVVILASNFKQNIDEAFLRRFDAVVQFPMPRAVERLRLWQEAFPAKASLDPALDLARIAEKYELSGGTIMNAARYAALHALAAGSSTILADTVEDGIRRELLKEGRAV